MALLTVFLSVLLIIQQVTGLYPTTGAPGQVYSRYEIRYLMQNRSKQFSLFIRALQALQNSATSNLGSYYQISGIHGLPNADWDGVSGSGGGLGYCTHNMNLFATWHRPYLALFEQEIVAQAKIIANQAPVMVRASWVSEANQLRLPYYDWIIAPATGQSSYPDVFLNPSVTIEIPSGTQAVPNPLLAYTFPNTLPGSSPPQSTWPITLRWPTSNAPSASSQNNLVRSTMDANRVTRRSGIYQMLVQCSTYNGMSFGGATNCPTGLESFHGSYHVSIGGSNGHMSLVPYAAFDPIFMLHHAMVDRLFAMWQVLYSTSWLTNQASGSRTKTISLGSVQGPSSPLTPFRNAAGQYWTSDTSRNVQTFAYTYDDLLYANGNAVTMQKHVKNLYGPIPIIVSNTYFYALNLVSTKFKLGGSYSIHIFLGKPASADPASWSYDANVVGTAGIFSSPDSTGDDFNATDSVSLTEALENAVVNKRELQSMEPASVVPYLQQNLQWRIVKDGKEYSPGNVPNFVATAVSSVYENSTSNEGFGSWSGFKVIPEVTKGKAGGYNGTVTQ